MQSPFFIAVDPGSSGAAVVREVGGKIIDVMAYHEPDDVVTMLHSLKGIFAVGGKPSFALIERVWASPVMGVSSAFAFGENYGGWVMAFKMAGIPVACVTPQQWQRVVAPDIQDSGNDRKKALKQLAVERFPDLKVTLAICDALLLSDYVCDRFKNSKPIGEPL
jgi:hypothetical protein